MTILLTIAAVFALSIGAGWILAKLDAPPPRQRIPRARYLGWSGSLWREKGRK